MSFDVQSIAEIRGTSDLWLHNQMYENILKQQNLQWTWGIFAKLPRGDFWGSCETQLDFHNQIAFQQSCQIFLVATWCKVWLSSENSELVLSYNLAAIAGIQMHHSKVANHGCNVLPSELKASNIVFQCLRKSFQIFFREILPNIFSGNPSKYFLRISFQMLFQCLRKSFSRLVLLFSAMSILKGANSDCFR